jgi:hypothetical protein
VTSPLPSDYFRTGSFEAEGRELLKSYTCLGCGQRLATWEHFAAHRRDCSGRLRPPVSPEDGAQARSPDAIGGEGPDLSPEPGPPPEVVGPDPFLDEPVMVSLGAIERAGGV